MTVPKETTWSLDPHTVAKHEILRRYLQRWFPILNTYHGRVTYIDGFCGPGRYIGGEPGSPLVALDAALNHRKTLVGEIVFWFVDERADRIEHLKSELNQLNLPSHFRVVPTTGIFHEKLSVGLDNLEKKQAAIAPTFAFIDPFGFSGIPFRLVERLLSKTRCEVFINFQVDSINRWLDHPNTEISKHFADLFGTESCFDISQTAPNRVAALRNLYQEQLGRIAKFIRYFEMRDYNDKIQYYMFFASNHPLGHVKMKEAMWAVDPDGGFRFSDHTNPGQQILFEADHTLTLWPILRQRFMGQQVLTDSILKFVNDETAFLETHMKGTLKKHLDDKLAPNERISVSETKKDGKKWRWGTFPPGVLVQFP